ncbi:MAG: serine hydroxymethyltransferase [Actinomycetes bacterium]
MARDEDVVAPWLSAPAAARTAELAHEVEGVLDGLGLDALDAHLHAAVDADRRLHDDECLNLDPAGNVANPRAEALLSAGLGTHPSLGHPGAKYEPGLEWAEHVEVTAGVLVRRVFGARHAELRLASGAMSNLAAFLATCRPGHDAVVVPPATIGGHVTHHAAGAAGLLGLDVHHAPIDPERTTVDLDGLADLVARVRPALVTIGGSLNLVHHDVAGVREVADTVGARVLVDAAHLSGLVAGGAWPDPLAAGAHLVTMSTYKSLGGPPGGLVLTDDDELGARVDAIAFPGLTANPDVGRIAAMAVTMLDWLAHGEAYAATMVEVARALGDALLDRDAHVWLAGGVPTVSHQVALDARGLGGGQAASDRLRRANLLACAIGLPVGEGAGLRLGTPEAVRRGVRAEHADELAELLVAALTGDPEAVAPRTTAFRRRFTEMGFTRA